MLSNKNIIGVFRNMVKKNAKLNLAQYIALVGKPVIARYMDVSVTAVESWMKFDCAPSTLNAWKLIERAGGVLTWESVYQPYIDFMIKEKRL